MSLEAMMTATVAALQEMVLATFALAVLPQVAVMAWEAGKLINNCGQLRAS